MIATRLPASRARRVRLAAGALSVVVFVLAILALHNLLAEFSLAGFVGELARTRGDRLAGAALAVLCSYGLLIGFDVVALRLLGRELPLPTIARTALVANALGHTLGFAALTGGAVRARGYGRFGLDTLRVGYVVATNTFGFMLGAVFWLAVALITRSQRVASVVHAPSAVLQAIGVALLLVLAAVLVWLGRRPREQLLFGKVLILPDARTGWVLLTISVMEEVAPLV